MTDIKNNAAPRIDSRASFVDALRWGFLTAFEQRARRIVCADPNFALWPLDDAQLLQALAAWLRLPQRQLVLLARAYDEVPRSCPRFNAWRANWSHAIEAWIAPAELAPELPTLLVADNSVGVQLLDAVHWRGQASLDGRRALQWMQDIDVVLQRSERGFPVNTPGL